jgi:uncharacterized membrane protein
MMTGFGMGFGLIGLVLLVVFWVGLIALAVWVVKSLFAGSQQASTGPNRDPTPHEILDRRYARGEITR